jgi:hypothetical protein
MDSHRAKLFDSGSTNINNRQAYVNRVIKSALGHLSRETIKSHASHFPFHCFELYGLTWTVYRGQGVSAYVSISLPNGTAIYSSDAVQPKVRDDYLVKVCDQLDEFLSEMEKEFAYLRPKINFVIAAASWPELK